MTDTYDLMVIGAGMAGAAAANKCASQGWKVAIVDELPYGGTCSLRGCDPKKILRRGAEIIDSARLLAGKGIDADGMAINWADLMKHKRGFTDPVPDNMEAGLASNGVDTLHGTAMFESEHRLVVDDVAYESGHFLIATGARPRPLDFPGREHLIDSTDFLELEDLPRRVLFVGGGFVSFELAHIAARAGSRPVIIDRGVRLLKAFDPDLVELLMKRGSDVGIEMRRETTITAMEPVGSGYRVAIDTAGTTAEIETDLVVHGAGRIPQLSALDLDAADVAHTNAGVTVEGHLQSTTNPSVYAAGDSADTPVRRSPRWPCSRARSPHPTCSTAPPRCPTTPASRRRCSPSPSWPRRPPRGRSDRSRHRRGRPPPRHQRLVLELPDRRDHRGDQDPR
jgi:glutathione reductase (NADPH)